MRRRNWMRLVATPMLLNLTACPRETAIWLLSGSAPGQPVFGLGQTRDGASLSEVPYVFVSPCSTFDGTSAGATWVLRRVDIGAAAPRQVQLGDEPAGYRLVKGPSRLQPGCYIASIDGTGQAEFEVLDNRSSVERAEP